MVIQNKFAGLGKVNLNNVNHGKWLADASIDLLAQTIALTFASTFANFVAPASAIDARVHHLPRPR